MNATKKKETILCHKTNSRKNESNQPRANIEDLPEEMLEIIAGFLSCKDLNSCFNVCKKWRRILNSDKFWKKCCKYPEKYFKLSSVQVSKIPAFIDACKWRKHWLLQKRIWKNWSSGTFTTDTFAGELGHMSMDSVDEHGNHWLFCYGSNEINVWNITNEPFLHSNYEQQHFFALWPLQDKVLTCRSNYVKVFNFKHPENELQLSYRFKFDRKNILPENEKVSNDDYVSGVRYILVDDRFLIGYQENVSDIATACMYIWDINTKKVRNQSIYQESFVRFVQQTRGSNVLDHFNGGMVLFDGDNGKFLVNLIDDRHKLCHVSLFSLVEMKFVKVVAQFESRTAWCLMKGDIVVTFHIVCENKSQISVFNLNTGLLAKLYFPFERNPILNNELRFDCNKVILKVRNKITVLTLTDSVHVKENSFELDESNKNGCILKYFDPKFLLLYDCSILSSGNLTVWDIDSGIKLWGLRKLSHLVLYKPIINTFEYPGRLLVRFCDESNFRILKFDA
ncbi:uncharacterized protein LOC128996143 [Macrosteles quadrilineatus]|uniref:uncharacterized protein LOC128996143 n=1 Tax=Macrosteles quadrilineatus TaxID=74068 RepID=UPI0023E1B81E|nr:uncharacterized protein LOC128996143 [Macrosteles quadrilineatus]XP_054277246.1 uncharacterized protein LOC128996143 [Macrosteles quadrilineatus]